MTKKQALEEIDRVCDNLATMEAQIAQLKKRLARATAVLAKKRPQK